jgi:peptide/nickel transport system substrate-binding protein
LNPRRPRPVGFLLSLAVLAAVAVYVWRAPTDVTRLTSRDGAPGADAPLVRGGEITGTGRGAPRSFNRYVAADQTVDLIATLTQGRLVRINRATFELEPWLAERWVSSADGRLHTLHLRPGVTWSDGTPFTSADVLFSIRAVFDPGVGSVFAGALKPGGQPIAASAPDAATVVITYAAPSGPGVRLLDVLPIYPRHKLEAALDAGTFAKAWDASSRPADIVGTGPFVLREYRSNERLVFDRNPRYWRTAADGGTLPLLDRVVVEIVPDQNAEMIRLQSGAIDFTHSELRPEDYVPVRRGEEQGTLKLVELGVSTDADAFWFCLKPDAKRADPRFAFVQRREFRQALSHAVDREEFAQTVFLGEAVPIWGPVTPGNRDWFEPDLPRYAFSPERARELLRGIGLEDRDGNGVVEDARGTEARFTVITQRGIGWYERGLMVLREQAAKAGIAIDIAPLEFGAMIERVVACNYDAVYMRLLSSDLDPAGNLDFWLSSGSFHVWNIGQQAPATDWERRIDTLMAEQSASLDPARRSQIFDEVQRLVAENLPVLFFAAPRMSAGHSARLTGVVPSILRPQLLWTADTLGVTGPASSTRATAAAHAITTLAQTTPRP